MSASTPSISQGGESAPVLLGTGCESVEQEYPDREKSNHSNWVKEMREMMQSPEVSDEDKSDLKDNWSGSSDDDSSPSASKSSTRDPSIDNDTLQIPSSPTLSANDSDNLVAVQSHSVASLHKSIKTVTKENDISSSEVSSNGNNIAPETGVFAKPRGVRARAGEKKYY